MRPRILLILSRNEMKHTGMQSHTKNKARKVTISTSLDNLTGHRKRKGKLTQIFWLFGTIKKGKYKRLDGGVWYWAKNR